MKALKILRDYFLYCGIDKAEYHAIKKDAYRSNFAVWRVLHYLMVATFAFLFVSSLFNDLMRSNRWFYIIALVYSLIAIVLFSFLKKDSIIAQLLIYLSISVLFLFACAITQNKPEIPATTFIVFLLLAPMFMIDRPFFMAIELCGASAVFMIWMRNVKPYEIWEMDAVNVVTFTIVGIFLNVIANSVRIREFVLTRKINVQKDIDDLTGLKNKGALTREINAFLEDPLSKKGILFILDVDRFKLINDTYGHDVGDEVIIQLGRFLGRQFTDGEIVGRFGGDEFIVFIRDVNDVETADRIARQIIEGASESVRLPDREKKIAISIGIAMYNGQEQNYSGIFKKADLALYRSKGDKTNRFCIAND